MRADIAETIRWWRSHGVRPAEVWESASGKKPSRIVTWEMVAVLLDEKSPVPPGSRVIVPARVYHGRVMRAAYAVRVVDGVSWREAA